MKTRSNRMDKEWQFAKACWTALREGKGLPPTIYFQTYEVEENTGKEKLVRETPIKPMMITYNGVSFFGGP